MIPADPWSSMYAFRQATGPAANELRTGWAWAGRIDMPAWSPTERLDQVAGRTAINDLVSSLSAG